MTENAMITLCAVGDVRIIEHEPEFLLRDVAPTLRAADITFCQLESAYSARGTSRGGIVFRAPPSQAGALRQAGIDVISTAGNHCLDFGHEALLDTVEILRASGLQPLGTGRNLAEAAKPVVVERDGTRIGFLAYNCIMPEGAWAEPDRPGCNAIRIYTPEGEFYTGETKLPRRPDIAADPGDVEAMVRAVKALKAQADIAVVSIHWGVSFAPVELAPYQEGVAHAAIDAGADLLLGHHPHVLKAIEMYKGKAIFYSIGNFAFDHSTPLSASAQARCPSYDIEPEYAGYKFHVEARKTLVVKCGIAGSKIARVSVLPAYINGQAQPQIRKRGDARFDEVVNYLKEVSGHYGYAWPCAIEGDEAVIVSSNSSR